LLLLRQNHFTSPIILLAAENNEGASDTLAKPFRMAVLLARIRALLRQFEASDEAVFTLGPYLFYPGAKLLREENGTEIKLTDKEAAILRYLHRHNSAPIARETLLAEVWGYHSAVTTHTLETHIYRLRQKIEGANLLVTENGGYRLNVAPPPTLGENDHD
jgi:DNA-binding response OmpR family regulator